MPRPLFEPLEPRQLLSITWANRGRDNFGARFGNATAMVARRVVDTAIADWNAVFGNAKIKLKITAANLARSEGRSTLAVASGKTIKFDDDAASGEWYFDPHVASDAENFSAIPGTQYAATADLGDRTDFYTVALHEIGHTLGFRDRKTPYVDTRRNGTVLTDTDHSNNPVDLMYPRIPTDTRYLISPYDVTKITKAGRPTDPPPRVFPTDDLFA